ncbi:MAG: DUF928 domain-containing protein [Microcoleaceae cyanobacterium]
MELKFHLTILATVALLTPIFLVTAVNAEIKILSPELIAQNIKFRTPDIKEKGDTRNTIIFRNRRKCEDGPIALIPETNIGLTLAEYPKFFVYFPASEVLKDKCNYDVYRVEFGLLDKAGNILYFTKLKLPDTSSIIKINLPDDGSIPPLAIGKKYQWYVSILLDPFDHSDDLFISGWIQRIEATPTLTQELQITKPNNHPKVYAEAGIWHETLDSLAILRQSDPNNSTFLIQWQDILKSVGLEIVADAPLLGISNNQK